MDQTSAVFEFLDLLFDLLASRLCARVKDRCALCTGNDRVSARIETHGVWRLDPGHDGGAPRSQGRTIAAKQSATLLKKGRKECRNTDGNGATLDKGLGCLLGLCLVGDPAKPVESAALKEDKGGL